MLKGRLPLKRGHAGREFRLGRITRYIKNYLIHGKNWVQRRLGITPIVRC
jgi:hypothetical protein